MSIIFITFGLFLIMHIYILYCENWVKQRIESIDQYLVKYGLRLHIKHGFIYVSYAICLKSDSYDTRETDYYTYTGVYLKSIINRMQKGKLPINYFVTLHTLSKKKKQTINW